jgi:serine/threonine-protein kinase RsbW
VQLCLEEAVGNLIMNSNAQDDHVEIAVELVRDDQTLCATIDDTGKQFDPTQLRLSLITQLLLDKDIRHLGVHLIRNFTDGMDYERYNDHNRLTLRFFVEPSVSAVLTE